MGNHESTLSPNSSVSVDLFGKFQETFDYSGTSKLSSILQEYVHNRGGNSNKPFRIAVLGPPQVGKSLFIQALKKVTTDRQYSCPVEFLEVQQDVSDDTFRFEDMDSQCHLMVALTEQTQTAVNWMEWEVKNYRSSVDSVSKTISRAGKTYKLPNDPMTACKELEFISRKFPKNTPPDSPLSARSPDLLSRSPDYRRSGSVRSISGSIFDGHSLYVLTKTGKDEYAKLKDMQTKEIRKLKRNSLRQDDPSHIWLNESLPSDYLDLYYKKVFMLDNTNISALDFPLLFLKLHDIMTEVMRKPSAVKFLKSAIMAMKNESGITLTKYQNRFKQAAMLKTEQINTELVAKELRHLIHELGLDPESLTWCEELGILSVDKVVRGINKTTMTTLRQLEANLKHVVEITAMKDIFAEVLKCIDGYCGLRKRDFSWGKDVSDQVLEQFGLAEYLPSFVYVMMQSESLGRGGQGSVWKCRDISNDRDLAVKEYTIDGTIRPLSSGVLLPDNVLPATAANLRTLAVVKEFQQICALGHENLVKYYALDLQGTKECRLWLFMELCEGGTLTNRAHEGLDQKDIVNYTRQIASALSYLHSNRVLHLDLKGDNVLLTNNGVLKLVDFGMHVKLEQSQTRVGEVSNLKGTLRYMAPEMIGADRKVGRKCDIWSLGCLLLEMLTGTWPKFFKYPNNRELEEMQILYYVGNGGKPDVPEKFLDDKRQTDVFKSCARYLLNVCLQFEPDLRPTADQVLNSGLLTENMMEPPKFIDVLVVGPSSSGKSFLINNLRRLRPNDTGASPVGQFGSQQTECYKHTMAAKTIRFWEAKPFQPDHNALFAKCSSCILTSNTTFSRQHFEIAKTLARNGKKTYFVRTKIGYDVENRILDGCLEPHGKIMKDIKNDMRTRFPEGLVDEPIYMVENRKVTEYEFRQLRNTVFDDILESSKEVVSSQTAQPKKKDDRSFNVLVLGRSGSGKSCLIYNLAQRGNDAGVNLVFTEKSSTSSSDVDKNVAFVLLVCSTSRLSKEEAALYTKLRKQNVVIYVVKTFATEDVLKEKLSRPDVLEHLSREEIFQTCRLRFVEEITANGIDAAVTYVVDNYEDHLYDLNKLVLRMCVEISMSRML